MDYFQVTEMYKHVYSRIKITSRRNKGKETTLRNIEG